MSKLNQNQINNKLKNNKNQAFNYAYYSGLGFQMIAVVMLGVFGGIKLDKYLALKFPIFTLVFSLLSVFIAMYLMLKDFINKKDNNSKK